MSDRSGHICPECGAPWEPGGSPTCGCARRAADELLQTRTAEAAAAEDFDPLRIRPYVDLAVQPEGSGTGGGTQEPGADGSTVPIPAVAAPSIPAQRSASPSGPTDFPERERESDSEDEGGNGSRRRRFVLVGAGATAVVVAAAGFASGLFSYESPSRGSATPDDLRASVPDASVAEPSPSGSGSPSGSPSPSTSGSASASTEGSAAPEASDSSTASASASSRATATKGAPPAEDPTNTAEPSPTPTERVEPPVLRPGDEGPEVVELQLRLKQLAMYVGEADGDYDNRTENAVRTYQLTRGIKDAQGVYTQETRERLESETSKP
ncbi:peptidoglycan-binding protein [Streptomyces apricus]|uniref:Peptidoglycan-binding protein n=1 Tax=Streptomyces apricus TaxID=1828112 RepID=A0A5B0AQL9_9ACTN|nr:peptidoglycan-binding protein [Streptomyces apricus]